MNRIITAAILLIGVTAGISSRASAQEPAIKANVPFDFAVGTHVLPAGTYRISAQGNTLALDNRDKKAFLFTLARRGDMATEGRSKLVFDNVQGRYFLRKVETTSEGTSVDFPISKLEKASREVAQTRSIYAETSSR